MKKSISSGLKTTFLVHAIVGIVLGLAHLLIPESVGNLLGWDMADPVYRLAGAAVIAFGVSSSLAYQADACEKIKIVVQAELVWAGLGALAILWGLLDGALPPAAWLNCVMLAGFAAAFGYFYTRPDAAVSLST